MAELGERVAAAALDEPALFKRFICARVKNGWRGCIRDMDPASTASRLDAFFVARFAEVCGIQTASRPAGSGYTETLSEIFRDLPVMKEFAKSLRFHSHPLSAKLLDALIATYLDWGGTSKRPAI